MKRNISKRRARAASTTVSTEPTPTDSFGELTHEQRAKLFTAVAANHRGGAIAQIENILAALRLTLTEAHSDLIGGIR